MLTALSQAYLAGITSAFTPCVYPLVPVTLAIFGATSEAPRSRALFLAVCYVLGIALTYTTLGLVSAQTGAIFGQFLGNPWVLALMTVFMVGVALYSLDLFAIGALATIQTRASAVGGVGPIPALLMGAVSGVVAAPCVGPFLISILSIAASSGDPVKGGLLLFVYSLGFGTLFLALAAFPNLARSLPRPGGWMNYVKLLIAALLLYVAVKLWAPFFPDSLELFLRTWGVVIGIGLLAIGAGAAVTAIRSSLPLLKLGAAVALGLATFTLVEVRDEVAEASQEEGDIVWKTELNAALGDATARGTIALVDLSAEWCAACKELELHTFPDPAVQQRLRKMTVARLDFTIPNDETDRIGYKYRVQGLPTILFLRPNGEEIPNSRITGFMPPAAFEQHLAGVLARSSP